jgi:hypothetical protein
MWAFCTGFRNLLAGIGAIVGLVILWTGDEAIGRAALGVIEEEQLEGCGCDVGHRADEGGGLGQAVHGVADVTRLWVLGRARIPDLRQSVG